MSKIKIVHLSTSANGGAGIAAFRIHEALLKENIDSHFVCLEGSTWDSKASTTLKQTKSYLRIGRYFLKKYLGNDFTRKSYYERKLKKIKPYLKCEFVSLPFSDFNILEDPYVKNADIIHLHWVAGMVDYPSFFQNNKKPIVWTFHDMNPFTGIFHFEEDNKRNNLFSNSLNQKIFEIKKSAVQSIKSTISIICPSGWLLESVRESRIFKTSESLCIRNTLDMEMFCENRKSNLKESLRIPEKNTIFLFAAKSTEIYRKGFDLLIDALTNLKINSITLLIVGDYKNEEIAGLDTRFLGNIRDNNILKDYYSVANAFIIPSREDNLPNVMLEAMACGTPVLSFNVGGMAEVIIDGFNGLKAYKREPAALLAIIEQFIKTKHEYKSEAIRNFAIKNFAPNTIAEEYKKVYESALKNNG